MLNNSYTSHDNGVLTMFQTFIAVTFLFHIFYVIAVSKRDFSIIDIAWGLSFVVAYYTSLIFSFSETNTREIILGIILPIWAIRLSGYIWLRSSILGKEDYRYANWRKDWGEKANIIAYFKVFWLQTILSLLIASPLIIVHQVDNGIVFGTWNDYIGLSLWIIGFAFEAIGDYQKHQFKQQDTTKKVLDTGLWRYTRHPNYFGEALLWWGITLIIYSQVESIYIFLAPLFLTFLLLKVSGVALLEEKYNGDSDYQKYKMRTSAFVPWFIKE